MKKYCKNQEKRAFTLVEILIGASLFFVIFILVIQVFSGVSKTSNSLILKSEIDQTMNIIMRKLINELQYATEVVFPSVGETKSFLIYRDTVNEISIITQERKGSFQSSGTDEKMFEFTPSDKETVVNRNLERSGYELVIHHPEITGPISSLKLQGSADLLRKNDKRGGVFWRGGFKAEPSGDDPKKIVFIETLSFTPHGDGALLVNLVVSGWRLEKNYGGKIHRSAIMTMVRLNNFPSERDLL